MLELMSQNSFIYNIACAYLAFYVVLAVHEFGHYIMNRLTGFEVETIEIGMKPVISLGKVKLGLIPLMGVNRIKELPADINENQNKRFLLKLSGGFIAQMILFILLSPFQTSFPIVMIEFVNICLLLANVVPYDKKNDGYKCIQVIMASLKKQNILDIV